MKFYSLIFKGKLLFNVFFIIWIIILTFITINHNLSAISSQGCNKMVPRNAASKLKDEYKKLINKLCNEGLK